MLWWDERLATGVESIDNQHKSIFDKAEEILCLDGDADILHIKKIFSYLVKYTIDHFGEEEDLMIQMAYPNFLQHRKQHTYFMNEIFNISVSIKEEGINERNMDNLKLLIIEWLANHISESDKQFVNFYNEL